MIEPPQRQGLYDPHNEKDACGVGVRRPEEMIGRPDPRIFACGDMRRGQSPVVWAIREGRDCAAAVNLALLTEARAGAGSALQAA